MGGHEGVKGLGPSHVIPYSNAVLHMRLDESCPGIGRCEGCYQVQHLSPGVVMTHPAPQVPIARDLRDQGLIAVPLAPAVLTVQWRESHAGVQQLQQSKCQYQPLKWSLWEAASNSSRLF